MDHSELAAFPAVRVPWPGAGAGFLLQEAHSRYPSYVQEAVMVTVG